MADHVDGASFGERHSLSSHESDIDKFPMDLVSCQPENSAITNRDCTDSAYAEQKMKNNTSQRKTSEIPEDKVEENYFSTKNNPVVPADEADVVDPSELLYKDKKEAQTRCSRCTKACRVKCLLCCRPAMTHYNPLPPSPTTCQRLKYSVMCPPHGRMARWLTLLLAVLFFYGSLWGITGNQALPGGNLFSLFILFIACSLAGAIVERLKLPGLLGMLLMGCVLRNVPYIDVAKYIDPDWSGALRSIALVVILIKAGMGLDPVALRKLSFGVIRLAFAPCLVETITAAITSHYLLGFPWDWAFMLGFVLSAVSPAVVVPSMLSISEKGLGVEKGIPTLVIAAASVDDVLAISGFGVVLGITFSTGNIGLIVIKGPLEAVVGIAFGIVFGLMFWYLPHMKHSNKTMMRFVLLLSGGLLAQFGSRRADIAGAGALGCLTLAFVMALRLRKDVKDGDTMPEDKFFSALWLVFQPLLFGLIGAEIDIMEIQPKTIGLGIAVLMIGLVLRLVASFLAVFGLGLNMKEKLFIPLAWLPKATVQAAIGSIALDTARAKPTPDPEDIALGKQLVTIAVLVILITAPLGALAIALSAPRLLSKKRLPVVDEIGVDSRENEGANVVMVIVEEEEDKPNEETWAEKSL